jgi:hypothetical protein
MRTFVLISVCLSLAGLVVAGDETASTTPSAVGKEALQPESVAETETAETPVVKTEGDDQPNACVNQSVTSTATTVSTIASACQWPCTQQVTGNCWWHYDPCPNSYCQNKMGPVGLWTERHYRCEVCCTGEAWCHDCSGAWVQLSKECVRCD